jgi:co-chaperonin GroES (HSP10)
MPYMVMDHAVDPNKKLKEDIGDISNIEIFNNQILVAVYIRPEKTKGGIMLPGQTRDDDKYQSKVGLVLKKGPTAFLDDTESWFKDVTIDQDDWVVFKPSDGWAIVVNNVMCRMIDDTLVRGRVQHPDNVW